MKNICEKLEDKLAEYLDMPKADWPSVVYLGYKEYTELDKYFRSIVQHIFNARIMMVDADSYVGFGEILPIYVTE